MERSRCQFEWKSQRSLRPSRRFGLSECESHTGAGEWMTGQEQTKFTVGATEESERRGSAGRQARRKRKIGNRSASRSADRGGYPEHRKEIKNKRERLAPYTFAMRGFRRGHLTGFGHGNIGYGHLTWPTASEALTSRHRKDWGRLDWTFQPWLDPLHSALCTLHYHADVSFTASRKGRSHSDPPRVRGAFGCDQCVSSVCP